MRLRQPQRGRKSTFAQPIVLRDRDLGFEPDFRFAAFVMWQGRAGSRPFPVAGQTRLPRPRRATRAIAAPAQSMATSTTLPEREGVTA